MYNRFVPWKNRFVGGARVLIRLPCVRMQESEREKAIHEVLSVEDETRRAKRENYREAKNHQENASR